MKEGIPMIDRYKGSLVGVAVGDSLGQPVEGILTDEEIEYAKTTWGKSRWQELIKDFRQEIKTKHGGVVREMLVNPFEYWQKGEYTDDTTQTLLLVDSFIEKGKYDPDDFVSRLLNWYDKGRARGMGSTTKISLTLIDQGLDWRQAGEQALRKGAFPANGSLMRTSPIGLYFRGYIEDIDRVASEISSVTHAAEQSKIACQIASQLVAQLANGVPKYEALDFVQQRYEKSYEQIMNSTDRLVYPGGAYQSLSAALISFGNANNFEEAITAAVNQMGDNDTYGAITGAFAGAYWGIAQIPDRWAREINPLSAEQIASKANNLYFLTQNLNSPKES